MEGGTERETQVGGLFPIFQVTGGQAFTVILLVTRPTTRKASQAAISPGSAQLALGAP